MSLYARLVAAKLAGAKIATRNGGEYVFRSNEAAAAIATQEAIQSLKEFADAEDRRGFRIVGQQPGLTHGAAVEMLRQWIKEMETASPSPDIFMPRSPLES